LSLMVRFDPWPHRSSVVEQHQKVELLCIMVSHKPSLFIPKIPSLHRPSNMKDCQFPFLIEPAEVDPEH
jgi:hypothetical protein